MSLYLSEVMRESAVGKENARKDERSTWASARITSRHERTRAQRRDVKAAHTKCTAELNFRFTTDMLWKMKELFLAR